MTEEKTVYTDEEKKISKESERKRPKMVKFAKAKKRKEQKKNEKLQFKRIIFYLKRLLSVVWFRR